MAEAARHMSFRATVLREGGEWVAHCLDLDLVSTGASAEAALDELAVAVNTQLWYAREHDNFEYLFRPAPDEAWRKLGELLKGPHKTVVRKIEDSDRGEHVLEVQLKAA
ncbi:MAG: hypothetical protein WED01_09425 [Candidatus Rokuibacteriota bacterium]